MSNHYVIGDVHGEYQTLLALVAKLPSDAKLVFVGDLTDRGSQSKEVVAFVRKNNHLCVMGNHDALLAEYGKKLVRYLMGECLYSEMHPGWKNSGRLQTFCSYGLVEASNWSVSRFIEDKKAIDMFLEEVKWLQKLPIYLELDAIHPSGKKVVVSHSNISKVWELRNEVKEKSNFFNTTLWGRDRETSDEVDIFNIYGHTPREDAVEIAENYVCVDRGCCYHDEKEFGCLSAYCVESGEVVEVAHV